MEDCSNNRNNTYRGLWAGYDGWEDGFKLLHCRTVTVRRCSWVNNNADGIWFDFDNKDILIEDSVAIGNSGPGGIHLEASQGPITLRRCKIIANTRAGLLCSHALNLTIEDCEFRDNGTEEIWEANFQGANFTLTEWDTSQVVDMNPRNWTMTGCRIQATAAAGVFIIRVPSPFAVAEGWRTTFTIDNNSYYSPTSATPFHRRNSDETFTMLNFADWKTYLGGSRDAASTFAATAAVPPINSPVISQQPAAYLYAQDAAAFVRPVGLVALPYNDDRVDLSWEAIAGASGYDVERDGTIVAWEVIPTSYSDTGLDPATLYSYRVRATRPP
jgi:hypothetical protein